VRNRVGEVGDVRALWRYSIPSRGGWSLSETARVHFRLNQDTFVFKWSRAKSWMGERLTNTANFLWEATFCFRDKEEHGSHRSVNFGPQRTIRLTLTYPCVLRCALALRPASSSPRGAEEGDIVKPQGRISS
jgi:hypothetical protein